MTSWSSSTPCLHATRTPAAWGLGRRSRGPLVSWAKGHSWLGDGLPAAFLRKEHHDPATRPPCWDRLQSAAHGQQKSWHTLLAATHRGHPTGADWALPAVISDHSCHCFQVPCWTQTASTMRMSAPLTICKSKSPHCCRRDPIPATSQVCETLRS